MRIPDRTAIIVTIVSLAVGGALLALNLTGYIGHGGEYDKYFLSIWVIGIVGSYWTLWIAHKSDPKGDDFDALTLLVFAIMGPIVPITFGIVWATVKIWPPPQETNE